MVVVSHLINIVALVVLDSRKEQIAEQREYKKKKAQKKVLRMKELEQEREDQKSKWQQFNNKAYSKNKKGQVRSVSVHRLHLSKAKCCINHYKNMNTFELTLDIKLPCCLNSKHCFPLLWCNTISIFQTVKKNVFCENRWKSPSRQLFFCVCKLPRVQSQTYVFVVI